MGANVSQLAALLSKEFIVLVLISMVVAVPLVWLGMTELLNHFAYRIRLDWWIFAPHLRGGCSDSLATVSFQPSGRRWQIR